MKKSIIAIIILVVLLVGTFGYIIQDKYSNTIYDKGYQEGYNFAITQVAQQSLTCQQVPLKVGQDVINIINVQCLQQ